MKKLDTKVLSKRISKAREKLRINQAQFAKKVGITQAAVSQIENEKRIPNTPVLHRVARVLKVSVDYLTGKTDESKIEDLLQQESYQTFFRGFQSLDPDDRDTIIKHVEFLKSKK